MILILLTMIVGIIAALIGINCTPIAEATYLIGLVVGMFIGFMVEMIPY